MCLNVLQFTPAHFSWSHQCNCHRKDSLLYRPHVICECFCLYGWFALRHKHKHRHKHKNLIATAQAYLHFAHVYLHSIIQDGGPRRRGRIARNWDFASPFTTTKQKSKESTNIKKEKYLGSQSSSCKRTLSWIYL